MVGFVVLLSLCSAFVLGLHLSGGRLLLAALAPAVVMAAYGGFAGAAASALGTGTTQAAGLVRGAVNGFAMGLTAGAILAVVTAIARRMRQKGGPGL